MAPTQPATADTISRWDQHGRRHDVHLRRHGVHRTLDCATCGWRTSARLLPRAKAEQHLAGAHQATIDPGGPRRGAPHTPS
ncbi:hypothetical protein ABT160_00755 [Streptomyces sp. NPDC001941]|uniref:hypothetical protein n=1 Tax=Streptomyces sp. NPDC001941 TaxID=3154659 RepID=UPI00332E084D